MECSQEPECDNWLLMQKMCKISSTAVQSKCISIVSKCRSIHFPFNARALIDVPLNANKIAIKQTLHRIIYFWTRCVAHSSAWKKSLRIIPQTSKRMCVENAMRLYAHHVCHVQIALFIVTKSNSINTCQRYGVFELNKFILSFIRTFHLALFHFRCPARSHERDTISYKRS